MGLVASRSPKAQRAYRIGLGKYQRIEVGGTSKSHVKMTGNFETGEQQRQTRCGKRELD
ncbi:hypothetical protein CBM2625_U40011 [Cupriavidus taiwanensis]|nr:hypothetical protein CBM2625_U40011 [Cupriavidus taiwanensis]